MIKFYLSARIFAQNYIQKTNPYLHTESLSIKTLCISIHEGKKVYFDNFNKLTSLPFFFRT